MKQYSFLIVGGDRRQKCLYELLSSKGMTVDSIFLKEEQNILTELEKIKIADVVILPIPSTTDGINLFSPTVENKIPLTAVTERISPGSILFTGGENSAFTACKAKRKVDLLKDEAMTLKNAMATAEAAISILIKETDKTIFGSNVLIIGYGRIAKILSSYLRALNARVTVCARKETARTEAILAGLKTTGFDDLKTRLTQSDIIINTVPSLVLGQKELSVTDKKAIIMDLASKPGGVDFKAAEILKLKTIHALSLPGKYSPVSAAEYIEQTILNTLT